jgi:hypothetical protein
MLYETLALTKLLTVTLSQRIYSSRLGIGFTLPISRRTSRPTFRWMIRRTLHFYFDTSGRRSCYIAPERFFASGARPDGALTVGNTDRQNKATMPV